MKIIIITTIDLSPENYLNLVLSLPLFSTNIIKLRKDRLFSKRDLSKTYYSNTWKSIYFSIDNQIFSTELLEGYFNKFWKIVSPKIEDGCHIFILLKFQFEDNNFHTIGKIIRINHNNYKSFIDQIINYMENMGDYYNQSPFIRIIFQYGFKRGEISENFSKSEINLINFKDMKLPISIDPIDYGKIIEKITLEDHKIYIIHDNLGRTILFKEFEKENIVIYNNKSIKILEFQDNKFSEGKFLRILGNRKLFFENGQKVIDTLTLNTPFISKLKKDKIENNNFITLDIETYGESELIPYLISFYDGSQSFSFYLADYSNIKSMMEACFKALFIRKYRNYQIYIHNLTKFDIYFLLKYLVYYVQVDPIIHNGRIIQLNINYGPDLQYNTCLKDSYLILLNSLSKLCKAFSVSNPKTLFPHLFVNKNNLDYIGQVPDFKYFIKISKLEYQEYKSIFNSNWNLKNEVLKYCELDCISLYQVLIKFNSIIFELFGKNIHKYPTLPSLAFAIFRSNFMSEENIPQLSGKIANDIRQAYSGGAVDVYIPKPPKGVKIKGYDVNSLYPSRMKDSLMPIGVPTYFEGNIRAIDPNAFGFFFCNIIAPDNIKHPIIQTHVKINNMTRTIAPIGQWTDMLFSMEMDNAMKFGYLIYYTILLYIVNFL